TNERSNPITKSSTDCDDTTRYADTVPAYRHSWSARPAGDGFAALATVRAAYAEAKTREVSRRASLCSIGGWYRQWRCDLYPAERFGQAHRHHLDPWMGREFLPADVREHWPSAGGARLYVH